MTSFTSGTPARSASPGRLHRSGAGDVPCQALLDRIVDARSAGQFVMVEPLMVPMEGRSPSCDRHGPLGRERALEP